MGVLHNELPRLALSTTFDWGPQVLPPQAKIIQRAEMPSLQSLHPFFKVFIPPLIPRCALTAHFAVLFRA